jgi:hypothetical protein
MLNILFVREATNTRCINTSITYDFKCIHTIYVSTECNSRWTRLSQKLFTNPK